MADHSLDGRPFKQIRSVLDDPTSVCSHSRKESVRSNLEVPVFISTDADLTPGNFNAGSDMFWKTNIT